MEQSRDVTNFFVSLAREFLDEWPLANLVCAYAGGSVGGEKMIPPMKIVCLEGM